ncbi:PorP/SprF family type IX secretion system membrane protein [Myroides odoratimimus]|uniref:PorP/SprF family type IX secretion system membrane protein n=1 Tax=Myroides odoratimimus TaxID=76832 RepID=UPI001CE073DE|nr:type IX secretion system membrane protein PorP/SprF [Myroides odoratimimus]MCA4806973.1 type IX secretion system membrane protein PorP/SprF [Myroides odoratimimus]
MKFQQTIRRLAVGVFFIGCFSEVQAQQDPQFTQYMYNPNVINPAYAGSKDHVSIFGMYRAQWVGMEGAPKTATISATTPLGDQGLALGVNFMNDRVGVTDENNISVDLSYTIDLNQDYKLAFGLKGTANLLSVEYSRLLVHNPSDPTFGSNIKNKFTPNIGAGLYLFSDKAYVGLSVPNFLSADRAKIEEEDVVLMRQKMHFYLTGGYVFELNPSVKFKPATMIKAVAGAPVQVDLSANFMFIDKFTLGVAYRWDDSVSGLAGFQVNDNLYVGYSYDANTSKLNNYNSGSHELFLRFDLFSRYSKLNAPRFF